jgi:hypothetical protein
MTQRGDAPALDRTLLAQLNERAWDVLRAYTIITAWTVDHLGSVIAYMQCKHCSTG